VAAAAAQTPLGCLAAAAAVEVRELLPLVGQGLRIRDTRVEGLLPAPRRDVAQAAVAVADQNWARMRQIPAPAEPAAIGLNGLSALVIIMQVVVAAVQRQAWRELLEQGALAAVAMVGAAQAIQVKLQPPIQGRAVVGEAIHPPLGPPVGQARQGCLSLGICAPSPIIDYSGLSA